MQIINRDVNFKTCQRVVTSNNICSVSTKEEKKLVDSFDILRKSGNEISSIQDLREASEKVRANELAKIRQLKKEQNGGFMLISSLTIVGTILVGIIVFMTIKFLVIG